MTLIAVGALAFAPQAEAQFVSCSDAPAAGKSAFLFKTSMWLTNALQNDFFSCGTGAAPTPATCTLGSRIYSPTESSCINEEVDASGAKLPAAFYSPTAYNAGAQVEARYETTTITPPNWPGPLGKDGETWLAIWDHVQFPQDSGCIGYYASQADILQFGEFGNARLNPCEQSGGAPISCASPMRGLEANKCIPANTPTPVGNIGGMAVVPIPIVAGTSTPNDFSAPGAAADLSWVPGCGFRVNDGAASPIMGYAVEAYVDANGSGGCDMPATCDTTSDGVWTPVLEIAPSAGGAPVDWVSGDGATSAAAIAYADLGAATGIPLSSMECIAYRLRVLFTDDRLESTSGGLDGVINPVASVPSGMSALIFNSSVLPALISNFVGNLDKNRANLGWTVDTDSFSLFKVSKSSERSGPFQAVGEVRGNPGQRDYEFTDDSARSGGAGRGNAIFYRLEASGSGGTEQAIVAVPIQRGKKD
jgi:hypothetical protein